VGYLCANFSLSRPLCSRNRPDILDRQIDRRQTDIRQTDVRRQTKASLNAPPIRGGGIMKPYNPSNDNVIMLLVLYRFSQHVTRQEACAFSLCVMACGRDSVGRRQVVLSPATLSTGRETPSRRRP